MPFVIDSPSDRVLEKAPRWDLMGTGPCGGGKVFWWSLLVLGDFGVFMERTLGLGGLWGGLPVGLLASSPSLLGVFWSKKNHHESFIPFGLPLVFLFCETLKQGKTETGTGLYVNRLVSVSKPADLR